MVVPISSSSGCIRSAVPSCCSIGVEGEPRWTTNARCNRNDREVVPLLLLVNYPDSLLKAVTEQMACDALCDNARMACPNFAICLSAISLSAPKLSKFPYELQNPSMNTGSKALPAAFQSCASGWDESLSAGYTGFRASRGHQLYELNCLKS